MSYSLEFDPANNILRLNGTLVSLHCHHFNCGLLNAIEHITEFDGRKLFVTTAAQEFYKNFKKIIQGKGLYPNEALAQATELYRFMGLGRIDLSGLDEDGGRAISDSSYYVVAWLAKYGRRSEPVCFLTRGFISGILAAIYDRVPEEYETIETRCMIMGEDLCEFSVNRTSYGG